MKKGRILTWVGLLLMMVGIYLQTFLATHWFIIGTLIALFGISLNAISIYLPRSSGGEGIKLKNSKCLRLVNYNILDYKLVLF